MVIELKEPERKMNRQGKGMLCPVCEVPLNMSDRQGVEIDYCPQCRGVWLDRGELDKIIERSATEVAPEPGPERRGYDDPRGYSKHGHGKHGGDSKHGGYGKQGHRRKSWLTELFD